MTHHFRKRRWAKIRQAPFSEAWREIIARRIPAYSRLDTAGQKRLEDWTQIFLAEKEFTGCDGLEMTDEIRVTIAAAACMLLVGFEDNQARCYPSLTSIFVYPQQYERTTMRHFEGGLAIESDSTILGESWHRGPIVLSWCNVEMGLANDADGHNVVFHEFAHQLDDESGRTDGAPVLGDRRQYGPWARVLGTEYQKLVDAAMRHRKSSLDKYGATNPAEFFAVVTEEFFEQPHQLLRLHPDLYEQFKAFYKQDPAQQPK
ncbi:MAG: zinc-dependent peptidase [Phycisphaerales bacterium]|nr:zinc-dependent peptidase [Phycisphaerales bacterium]